MKQCFKQIIVRVFLVCFLFCLTTELKSQHRIDAILKEADQAFSRGELNRTLDLLFLQAHYYRIKQDSVNLCGIWSQISIINRLQKQYIKSKAALRLATESSRNNVLLEIATLFNDTVKGWKGYGNRTLNDNHILRYYWLLRFQLICNNTENRSTLFEKHLRALIGNVMAHKDTLWFGYRNMLFEEGSYFYDNHQLNISETYFKRVISISKSIRSISQESLLSYRGLFRIYSQTANPAEQLKVFKELIALFDGGVIYPLMLDYYYKVKGSYYYLIGDYAEAINAFLSSKDVLDISNRSQGTIIYNVIDSYFRLGDYSRVIEWDKKYNGLKSWYYDLMIAYSHLRLGNIELAVRLEKKINKQKLLQQSMDKPDECWLLYRLFIETKRFVQAEHYFNFYVESVKLRGPNNYLLNSNAMGRSAYFHWIVKGDIKKALYYYQKELYLLLRKPYQPDFFKEEDISRSISDESLAMCLRNKGEAFLELAKEQKSKTDKVKYLEACLTNFEMAFTALNKYKFAMLSEEKKLTYSNLTRHYYSYVIEASYQLYQITGDPKYANKAFEYIEKSKASVLLSMIKGSGARKLKMVPDEITVKEDYISECTDKYSKQIADENAKASPNYAFIDKINSDLQNLRLTRDTLLDEVKAKYASYYNLKYGADVSNIRSLQHKLTANQVLLQYSLNRTYIYIFFVSKTSFKIVKAPIDASFEANLNKYRKSISNFSYEDTKDASLYSYYDMAYQLYQKLIAPVENLIGSKELIIIPDDILNAIPFEALVTQAPVKTKDVAFKDLPYLIKRNSITYNYSASLFGQMPEGSLDTRNSPKLLAMAPIHSQFVMSDIKSLEIARDSNEIMAIPGTIDEVKSIHKIFYGKLLLGKSASETAFKDICNKYDIIHIASHGFVNNEHPLFSKLVFNHEEEDTLNDGLLNTYEIYNLHISAPLVVLSACNTGWGKLYKGEGTVSLARGFYAAGAKNILMTLWSITDKTSNKLVQQFYTNLAKRQTVSISLQQAKLNFIKDADEISAHPFFWAGYISVGEPSVRFGNVNHSQLIYWVVGGVVGLLLLLTFILWKRRQTKILSHL